MTLDDIKVQIESAKSIVVLTHENPDGDAMGCALAMYNALKQMNKEADVIIPEFSRCFNFLPSVDEIKRESDKEYDLAIAVDCSDTKRLNGFVNYFDYAKVKVQIDHHGVNTMFADYNYVDPVAPACAQILVKVLPYCNIEITKDIGTFLLTGIITDTGGFKYSGVTAETFEFAAWLLQKGVNVSNVYRNVLQTVTKGSFELNRIARNRVEFFENGKVAFTYITKQDEKSVDAETGDYEGIVDIGRDVEGVEISIFLRELEKGGYKVSMRSNDYVNVSDICLMFGGGGHVKAAGCTITSGTLEQVRDKVLAQAKLHLK